MKIRIALVVVILMLGSTLIMWYQANAALTQEIASHQEDSLKFKDWSDRTMTTMHEFVDEIGELQKERDGARSDGKAMAQAFLDEYAKNQKALKLAEQMNDNFNNYSAAVQKDVDSLSAQNNALRITAMTPPNPVYIPVAAPTLLPQPTTTSGMIIHPDGSMSEIYLNNQ